MGFRLSKSIKIIPGVRLNVSTRGLGYSLGGKGLRVTKHANGRISRTLSIPGTGLSHQSTLRGAPSAGANPGRRTSTTPTAATTPPTPKPGIFAPAWEKDLYTILNSSQPADYSAISHKHGRDHPYARALAATLEGLLHFEHSADNPAAQARARSLLAWAAVQPITDPMKQFCTTYLPGKTWPVQIVAGINADLHLYDDVVLLAAAELHQAAGDLAAAIWTAEQAQPTTAAALSLAELYSCADRHQDVIDMTTGITNQDDTTALLLALRGRAFAQLGYNDAARESFTQALRNRSRSAPIRHRALLERALVDVGQNRKAAARKNLEKILAEDPDYPELREALQLLT
ncbi:putative PEP-CTERM system TPR-repeat lipoprotein [Mycobacteroides abscessus subsp. abscessus]|uniref:DUF4236 domain-containing protein n=1 Tax=Mycobacteroides abscessus TaxID=36809 RepID=UPI00092CDF53|nr:DUF4236 domain-containing protein [Mycobacteroides abscessus]SIH20461.1 putative PEP-CTERM system TPR-repeat lipoprotein [Mycobacteroides abscessus subsp. abscessus]